MVVGHTLQPFPTAFYNGQIICIDMYHEENLRQGFVQTLLIENENCYAINTNGHKMPIVSLARPALKTYPSQR
jgi:hypothetical protein